MWAIPGTSNSRRGVLRALGIATIANAQLCAHKVVAPWGVDEISRLAA